MSVYATQSKPAREPKPRPWKVRWDPHLEIELLRDLCRRDFWTFLCWGFGAMANPKGSKWLDEAIHKPLADWFMFHVEQWEANREKSKLPIGHPDHRDAEVKHLAIIVHREVGKTTTISQAGQAWLHLRDPEFSSYTGSVDLPLSAKIVEPIKAVMDGSDRYSLWSKLYGNWSEGSRRWKSGEVVHSARKNTARKDPSLGSFAVETSIVGAHPDAIFYDDPISYERMRTDANWLETVNEQIGSLIPVLQGDGLNVLIGTRYSSSDHFGVALTAPEQGGDGIASVAGLETSRYQPHKDGLWHVYFLAGRDESGHPTTPKIWPEQRLKNYQRREPVKYAAQVMNDPTVSEFNPITPEQLRQCEVEKKDVPFAAMNFAILCDYAFWDGQKRINKDETVYLVIGYPRNGSGDVYFIEGYGDMYWRPEDFANRIVSLVQRYRNEGRRIAAITAELPMSGMKGLPEINLRNYFSDANERMPRYLEFTRGNAGKVDRIVAAVDFWVDGHVRVIRNAPGWDRLQEQMARIGEMQLTVRAGRRLHRKDDWVDAMADAFRPELYQPMRRPQGANRGQAQDNAMHDGMDRRMRQTDEDQAWYEDNPRRPMR